MQKESLKKLRSILKRVYFKQQLKMPILFGHSTIMMDTLMAESNQELYKDIKKDIKNETNRKMC